MLLFLDDIRTPKQVTWISLPSRENCDWKIVRSFKGFCNAINDNWLKEGALPEFISFDHDLAEIDCDKSGGWIEKTGFDCAQWLIDFCIDKKLSFPKFEVHSLNPIGKKRIISLIESFNNFS